MELARISSIRRPGCDCGAISSTSRWGPTRGASWREQKHAATTSSDPIGAIVIQLTPDGPDFEPLLHEANSGLRPGAVAPGQRQRPRYQRTYAVGGASPQMSSKGTRRPRSTDAAIRGLLPKPSGTWNGGQLSNSSPRWTPTKGRPGSRWFGFRGGTSNPSPSPPRGRS